MDPDYTPLTEQELRDYARTLIEEAATEVEWLTIHERAVDLLSQEDISDEDAHRVSGLIGHSTVTVHFAVVEPLFKQSVTKDLE
jgi:hypothetical protein